MLFIYVPRGIARTLDTIGIQFHPSVQYLYPVWWDGRSNLCVCVCVVHGFVERHGLQICAGTGLVQDNKATHFAYFFSFWAWLKEVPVIMLVLWLHSDPLAKRPFFFCETWDLAVQVCGGRRVFVRFLKIVLPPSPPHTTFLPMLLSVPKLKQGTHDTGSEWLKIDKCSEILINLSIHALPCESLWFISCSYTKSARRLFCTKP